MKKRLMCLFLCLVMIVGVLASCSQKSDEEAEEQIKDAASEAAITLTLWVVSEEEVSPETAASVSAAINALTKAKFKTQIDLRYYTEDQYRAKLEETIRAYEEDLANRVVTLPSETEDETTGQVEVTDETETNEYGMSIIKYPEALKNQVDIIYIAGEDMYLDFIKNEWLLALDTELSSASKKIKEYVSATLLSAAKQDGVTYAVPNNRVIGEYTYMLLNKKLMDKYAQQGYVTTGKIDGFYNEYLYTFLNLVNKFEDDSVVTIDNTYSPDASTKVDSFEYCLDLLAHYWALDPSNYTLLDQFSVFGYHYQSLEELTRGSVALGFNSLFEDEEFTEEYLQLNKFRFDGYFGDATGKTAALRFVDGDYTFLDSFNSFGYCEYEGEKYYPIPVAYPTASTEDIYGNMFGVCSYTRSESRSMEIVTYMNTNAEFRNILQYGVEGTHYELIDNGNGTTTVKPLVNDYKMDIYATGNVFLAHPEPQMSPDIWENGKIQNRYSMVDPLLGFDLHAVAESTIEEEAAISIDRKLGYTLLYSTGYSKDVLSQNAEIAKFLSDADAAGKGLYVFKTYLIEGSSLTINYYVYNNNLTKKTKFSVEDIRETETTLNEKGKEVVTQTNLDFILTYEDTAEDSETGYELSLVSLYTTRTNEFEILAKNNGKALSADQIKTTEHNKLITFDFLNTQKYSIDIYKDVHKPSLIRNAELMNWISECDAKRNKQPTSYILTYTSAPKNGKVDITLIAYRTGLDCVTEVAMIPAGDADSLELRLQYSHDESKRLDQKEGDVNYKLYFYNITLDADMAFSYTVTSNGEVDTEVNVVARTEANGDADPDFLLLGTLDTELVKYMYDLNNKLVAKINACQTYEELVALTKELRLLLRSDPEIEPIVSSFTILADVVADYVVDNELLDFHRNTQCITGYEQVTIMVQDPENPTKQIEGTFEDNAGNKEPYIYYASPYALYRSWMQTYGFLPK